MNIVKQATQLDALGNVLYITTVQESPLEPGVFLYPDNVIPTLPDMAKMDTHVIQWDGQKFNYSEKIVDVDPVNEVVELTPEQELEALKIQKIIETTSTVNEILSVYTYDYSEPEKLSWPKQETEATALLLDENATAPFVRQLAAVRDMDVLELRDRILDNVEDYTFLTALLIGTQQKYIDIIHSFTVEHIEELRALRIVFLV